MVPKGKWTNFSLEGNQQKTLVKLFSESGRYSLLVLHPDGDGQKFIENPEDILKHIQKIKEKHTELITRQPRKRIR